jgi:hypothetical protein
MPTKIEQCHKFLKEGGYLAVVIPDGILTNSSMQYVRDDIERMFRLGFTLSIPDEISQSGIEQIIENFGKLLQPQIGTNGKFMYSDIVEAFLRYEDDSILQKIQQYHKPIFEIEMRLREVLNYILSYNLEDRKVFEFLKNFERMEMASDEMKKSERIRFKRFGESFENELFHVVMTKYSYLSKLTEKREISNYQQKIRQSTDLVELKNWLNTTDEIDAEKYWEATIYLLDTIFESAEVDDNDEITFMNFDLEEENMWIEDFQATYLPDTIQNFLQEQFNLTFSSSELQELEKN